MFSSLIGRDRSLDGTPSSASTFHGSGSNTSTNSQQANSSPFKLQISLRCRSRRPVRTKRPSLPPFLEEPASLSKVDVGAETAATPSASVLASPSPFSWGVVGMPPIISLPPRVPAVHVKDDSPSNASSSEGSFYSVSSASNVPSRTVSPSLLAYSPHRLSSGDEQLSVSTASSPLLDALGRLTRRKNPVDAYAKYQAEKHRLNMSLSQTSLSAWDMVYFIAGKVEHQIFVIRSLSWGKKRSRFSVFCER